MRWIWLVPRPVSGMQPIRAMVKRVHAVELAPAGKQPVTERRDPARQARFQGRRIRLDGQCSSGAHLLKRADPGDLFITPQPGVVIQNRAGGGHAPGQ